MLEPNKNIASTTVSAKEADRTKINTHIADFLANGGEIEYVESELVYGNYQPAHVPRENSGLGGF